MTALIVIGSIFAYVAVAAQTARVLAGHFRYNKWLAERKKRLTRGSYSGTDLEYDDWHPGYDDSVLNAGMWAGLFLPVALVIVLFLSVGNGQWVVDPKKVRKDRELKAARERIAELEKVTGV